MSNFPKDLCQFSQTTMGNFEEPPMYGGYIRSFVGSSEILPKAIKGRFQTGNDVCGVGKIHIPNTFSELAEMDFVDYG